MLINEDELLRNLNIGAGVQKGSMAGYETRMAYEIIQAIEDSEHRTILCISSCFFF